MKVLFTLIFVFSTASLFGDTVDIRPSWSGAWFNPDQPGHGISVEVLDDERTIFFWYTYDPDGNPLWLVAQGVNESFWADAVAPFVRIEATAYYNEGMIFGEFVPADRDQQEWGTIILDFPYWECSSAHMEWFPAMEGFVHGSTDLVRLTSLYGLDCVKFHSIAGDWEVQFGYDAAIAYQAEIVATPDPKPADHDLLYFEFLDETDCLWSGEIQVYGFYVAADWSNHCGATAVEHSDEFLEFLKFEHKLCDSGNECARKDEVMIFEDEGEYLIFSR